MQQHWVRFAENGREGFGTLEGERVRHWHGNLFEYPERGDRTVALSDVSLLTPVQPSKVIALWNNFGALREKLKLDVPAEPLYLVKTPNTYLEPGGTIRHPGNGAKIVFEGELGIVIGQRCKQVSEADAPRYVLGYTCANDVTLAGVVDRDPSFGQWVRAKGLDTFCPFGPAVATGIDPQQLVVRTWLDGQLRQDYPISDMRFSVAQLVSHISQDMTLFPGDIILCGTSVGVGSMQPGSTVEVEIAGVGRLANRIA
ncbi:fumarylacetoacetate hydrolase family protein [Ramlibacter sp. G-1-2-2]|uniref:Fumarylacetoacetate hydrolase family protein n=1 Tax=Ramlibacter agri TaxID=2728837 RepID=A0A848H2U9_9BURK|nr:fumarylacetoacetate hydrolase family protein [Ramlibacter agri]NML45296.1 fumarylacetoacetate hydrolase family protein [Ramlibacter agri]